MTTVSIIENVRRLLSDEIFPVRWSDVEIRKDIQFAIRELHKIRPETRYPNGRLVDCVILPDRDSDEIAIDDRYEECLSYYAAYLCYLDDNSDTVNEQLASSYLNKFNVKAQL